MDLSLLPTVFMLTVFVAAFRPLVRRAGPHTNTWFLGWTFLLLHYLALFFTATEGSTMEIVRVVIAIWSIEFCGLCFVLAASRSASSSTCVRFTLTLGLPIFAQANLYAFNWNNQELRVAATLLFFVPGLYLLFAPKYRCASFNIVAAVFALIGAVLLPFPHLDPYLILDILLCALFLSAAYLAGVCSSRTRGIVLTVIGLSFWGLSYPLQAFGWLAPEITFNRTLLDLPRYLVAVGMILSFLDEHLHRTEALALHDALTGLPNRRLFELRLEQAIAESNQTHTPLAYLVIDVNKFKFINDNYGHAVGDGILQALATRLSWNLGPRDMLARTGGDEFTAILVEAADEYNIRFVAGAMLSSGCLPVSIGDRLIDVSISIGIAVIPQDATDSIELHRYADEAMYRAKNRGGSHLAFAHEELPKIHTVLS